MVSGSRYLKEADARDEAFTPIVDHKRFANTVERHFLKIFAAGSEAEAIARRWRTIGIVLLWPRYHSRFQPQVRQQLVEAVRSTNIDLTSHRVHNKMFKLSWVCGVGEDISKGAHYGRLRSQRY